MYANQVCSRIRSGFCKRACLNPQEKQSNGVYDTLVGLRDVHFERRRVTRLSEIYSRSLDYLGVVGVVYHWGAQSYTVELCRYDGSILFVGHSTDAPS
jgi:hypothetical protein